MRCSAWSSLAISVCSALVLAGAADAHVTVAPAFLGAESDATLSLTAPNERDEPMTGFAVTVPSGFEIVHAHPTQGWEGDVQGATAIWTGGSLASGAEATFGLALQAPPAPGAVELQAEQRYPGGEIVRWPVALTVTPAADSPSQNLGLATVVGLLGLLGITAVGALLWRRRGRSLQER